MIELVGDSTKIEDSIVGGKEVHLQIHGDGTLSVNLNLFSWSPCQSCEHFIWVDDEARAS
ncbi:hypothetical protein V2J09_009727 [Rumex salicifolius]